MTDGKHNRSSDDDGEGPSSKKPRTDEPSDDSDKYTTTDSESGEGGDDPEEGGEKSEEDEDEPEEGDEEPEGDDEPEEEDDDPEEGDDNPEEGDNDPEEGGDDPEEDNNDPEEGDDDPEEGDEESKEDEEDREDNGDEPEDETPAGGVLSAPDLPSDDSDRYTTSESSKDSPEGGDKTRKDDDDDPEERSDEYGEGDYRTEDRSSESEGDSAFTTSIKASGLQPPRSLAQEGWKGVETIGEGGFGVALRYSRTVSLLPFLPFDRPSLIRPPLQWIQEKLADESASSRLIESTRTVKRHPSPSISLSKSSSLKKTRTTMLTTTKLTRKTRTWSIRKRTWLNRKKTWSIRTTGSHWRHSANVLPWHAIPPTHVIRSYYGLGARMTIRGSGASIRSTALSRGKLWRISSMHIHKSTNIHLERLKRCCRAN